jgi:endonuclease YncB( thermonuclease family)
VTYQSPEEFYKTSYRRYATFVSAYDADSLRFNLDMGDHLEFRGRSVRVYGIDAPEKAPRKAGRTEASLLEEKAAAREALARVESYIAAATGQIVVQTIKRPGKNLYDKYGRVLGIVWIPVGGVMIDLAERLLVEGHAKPYLGGTKPPWELIRTLNLIDPTPQLVGETLEKELAAQSLSTGTSGF